MKLFRHQALLVLVMSLLGPAIKSQAAGTGLQVWTETETRHVLRSELPGGTHEARLAAARNEWRSFQILLRSEVAIQGVRLEVGAMSGPGGAILAPGNTRVYRQHQLFLENGTSRNTDFKPDWYPDPLIPVSHPVPGMNLSEARIKAIPFDLPPNETHGFWVDIYVPSKAVAGTHRATYRLTAQQDKAFEIPVILMVWDFALPAVPTLITEFGSPAPQLRNYYRQRAKAGKEAEPQDWAAVEAQCDQLLSDHRLNAFPPPDYLRPVSQAGGSFRIPQEKLQALREFVDRYHVNALQIPHPSNAVKDPEVEKDKLRAWLAAFNLAASELSRPQIIFYTYLRDEPNNLDDYRYVQKWGRAIRDAKSVIKVLVVEQTWTAPGYGGADSAWGDLYGAVDIWCPLFSLHRQDSAAKRQALGEMVWTYTALCQGSPTPWWHIDFPLLNYRAPAWIAWRYRMNGLLYWGGLSYWRQTEDPWSQAPFYTGNGNFQQGRKGIVFNGEGSLVYPARAVGYDGIAPTVRLKALRDSIEDYEYFAILNRLGKAADAERVVSPLATSFFEWEKNPGAYDAARAKLAELILSASK